LETFSPPEIKTLEANVEEAEWKTFVREESPFTARELDAERAPMTWRELLKVEDDWVTKPPRELMKKRVEVPVESVIEKALDIGLEVETKVFNVRMFEVEEVAATVRTDLTSAVVVPIATLSVRVVWRTRVPVSVHPPAEDGVAFQERVPEPSVWRNPKAVCEEGQVYDWPRRLVTPLTTVKEPEVSMLPLAELVVAKPLMYRSLKSLEIPETERVEEA
jgi:hypothetical protein